MSVTEKVVFIHGLGESPQAWDRVIEHLPSGWQTIRVDVFSHMGTGSRWNLDEMTDRISREIPPQCHIVGLSLGAVIALNLAVRSPQVPVSLFLSAPVVKPPRTLMRIQNEVMRLLPEKLICPPGVSKAQMLDVLQAITDLDLIEEVVNIRIPTTVACGLKDRANMKAATYISTLIPDAKLLEISAARHQWHTQMPQEFARHLTTHLTSITRP